MFSRSSLTTVICLTLVSACTVGSSPNAARPPDISASAPPPSGPAPVRSIRGDIDRHPPSLPSPAGPPTPFDVEGRPLPTAVVSAYTDGGGQLLQNAEVLDALDLREFPYPSAMGVVVTDASVHTTTLADGLVERDEGLGWLLVDDRTLGELLDGLAARADLTTSGWQHDIASSTQSGAECTEQTYANSAKPLVWTFSGCSYPGFAGLRAVQVRRRGTYRNDAGAPPAMVSGSWSAAERVASSAGLTPVGWGIDFTRPDGDGVTTTVTAQFDTPDDATSKLRAGLSGWTELPADEDHGERFQSADDEWEVTPNGAVFTHRGRFPT